jgi:hypothetical protein
MAKVWKNPGVTIWNPAPGLAYDGEWHSEVRALKGHAGSRFGADHSRKRLDLLDELLIVRDDLLWLRESLLRHGKVKGENVIGAETGIDSCQVPEAVDGKTGASQQGQR